MRLKKLELYGFKSFAQRTEIVFREGITGIVGPNGSGKSNIGDAVRWVLGEQSAKTLRGASMSDVIFNGTQKRKPHSYCEVSLVFDNEDRALPMDYSEIMVTRRVYRNGESEYYLNRSSVRLKDVVDLFRDTGIGKEGYSIIGQGRIDEILSRKSEDRRQVFEEAAGIVKFRTRKEEADKKLQRTLENAERIDDILEELTRQLGPLERQCRAARKYIELSGELKTLDLNLFLIKSDRANQRLGELDTELMGLRAVLADAEAALADKTAHRDEHQTQIADLEEKITGARNGLMACAEQLHQAQSELAAVNARMQHRQETRSSLLNDQQESETALAELDRVQSTSEADRQTHQTLVTVAENALTTAREKQQKAIEAETLASAALDQHKADMLSAMNRMSDVRNNQTRLTTMRTQLANRLEEIGSSTAQMQTEEARLMQAAQDAADRKDREEEVRKELHQAWMDEQEKLREAENRYNAVRTEAENLSNQLQSTQSRWRVLSEMAREMEGYNQSVRRAMQYAKDRSMQGVRGVLAQLLTVPAAYETAIDMALGAAQQNIVTDNEETAKALIDYLRENRLGRATFLPRSAIRSNNLRDHERKVLTMPGCLGVASELVQCAADFRGIVENLLGRTVICDHLNHGIAIMRAGGHSFRLVTLEGDVMHSGGSMTGGSTSSKVANLLSREREVKELAEKLKAGRVQFDALKARLEEIRQQGAQQRTALNEAADRMHQQEIAVARETERAANAQTELTAHRARMEQNNQAHIQLSESIAQIDMQLSTLNRPGANGDMDQAVMEERTVQLQQSLSEAKLRSQEAADLVMHRTLQLSDLRHSLAVMENDAAHYAENRAALVAAMERRREQLAQMAALDEADADEQARHQQAIAEYQHAVQRQEQLATALENRRNDQQDKLKQVLLDMEHLHETRERDSEKLHQVEMRRSRVDSDLRTLQDRIWNMYQLTYAGAAEFKQEEGFNEREAEKQAAVLNGQIRALGSVNVNAVEEYAETKARYDELTAQLQDLRKAENDLRELIDRLLQQMRVTFVDSFTKLQGYFSETFVRLFGGGHAELKLMDPDDPLNCGIEVNAQPPGKKLQLLSLLSGGERALCAIAILFAMLKLKPTPFCILDEIEAALDDANIGYYADYLLEYSRDTQFIVVTHRKGTMERCNALFGVAMEEQGVSRMVSVSLQDSLKDAT